MKNTLDVYGANENNLKDVHLKIPLNQFVVFTGLSGSGKSSLAFNTIFAEGQRRYLETYSNYVRQFIGGLERPKVDKINGLHPVISIEQKTVSKSPRSTVGTITEVYDFLRLLFARTATAISINSGESMIKRTQEELFELVCSKFNEKKMLLFAPKIKGRKGHYKELFESILRSGYTKVLVDGELLEIRPNMKLDRYKTHDISILIDRLEINELNKKRIMNSMQLALSIGNGHFLLSERSLESYHHFSTNLVCPSTGISYPEAEPNLFSFNSPYGACKKCNGLGKISEIDFDKIIPDKTKSIKQGGILPLGEYRKNWFFDKVESVLFHYSFKLHTPIEKIDQKVIELILYGNEDMEIEKEEIRFEGISNYILKNQDAKNTKLNTWALNFLNSVNCPECNGYRLNQIALHHQITGKHIGEVSTLDLNELAVWINDLERNFTPEQNVIAAEILKELSSRIKFLLDVGLSYLHLNRPASSLSGGESQRIRLATQIGTKLVNVIYILDEPSIGLHSRDNQRLIESLKLLKQNGNSILVVEHDKDIIENADFIVEIGPYAGKQGGEVSAFGTLQSFLKQNCLTSAYLCGEKNISIPKRRTCFPENRIQLIGASGHNLKNVSVSIPIGAFTCITGVSGSGKSSLINQTLYPLLMNNLYGSNRKPLPFSKVEGIDHFDKVIEIDQKPIGRTPRSNPSTYTKVFDEIRRLFSELPEAQIRGYKPGRFSFNVAGGKCETCNGGGLKLIEMNFLPDVYVECEDCRGARYNEETLQVLYKGKNISQVLNLSIQEAFDFFENIPKLKRILKTLVDVGLGYLTLGQSSTTLSGGEAQRIKLAAELSKKSTGKTLYLLDEPSTGLHFEDIHQLIKVLQSLVDEGNTVLVIEHNLDIIKTCDYIIDLGPEGGKNGGEICAQGSTDELLKNTNLNSPTLHYLRKELNHNC